MASISAELTKVIDAPAASIYGIIADYHDGHQRIIPPKYITDLVVEEGGRGAGTVIRFRVHVPGGAREMRARIDEPEPGRVLTETNLSNGGITTFIVEPLASGARSTVTIRATWKASGAQAVAERLLLPPLLRRIFAAELELLAAEVTAPAAAGAAEWALAGMKS